MKGKNYCIQHIGIPTENYAETVAFYQSLGFVKSNETYNINTGSPVVFMKQGDVEFEVYEVQKGVGKAGAIDHIAINVENIEEEYQRIVKNKIRLFEDGITFLPFKKNGVRFFIVEGPNQEKIEFNQEL